MNNRYTIKLSHYYHKNIDWVEIKAEKTFELRIQAIYQIEPKCIQARRRIKIGKLTEQRYSKDTANATSRIGTFFTKDDYKNTIIISLSSILVTLIITFTVIAIMMKRRIREGTIKVDVNSEVYGTYYGGEVEYSEVADSNPYYGS